VFCRSHGAAVRARLAERGVAGGGLAAGEPQERAAKKELDAMWRALSAAERAALGAATPPPPPPPPSAADRRAADGGMPQEQRLYAALRHCAPPRPAAKELKESLAFVYKVQKLLRGHDLVIDVAGSHGMVAMLFLAFAKCATRRALVLDPFQPRSFDSVREAWAPWLSAGRPGAASASASASASAQSPSVAYDERALEDALPALIAAAHTAGERVCVVACHACAHLTARIVDICMRAPSGAVAFAVMPCCHKDHSNHQKQAAKALGVELGVAMDLVLFGRALERGYQVRVRTIDREISPHNRIVVGLPPQGGGGAGAAASVGVAEEKLRAAYVRVHRTTNVGAGGGGGGDGGARAARRRGRVVLLAVGAVAVVAAAVRSYNAQRQSV
jgi:hypothetical protein